MIFKEVSEQWKPYCYEEGRCKTYSDKDKIKPGPGPWRTCQTCGYPYDDCICQFLEEPCLSCKYKEMIFKVCGDWFIALYNKKNELTGCFDYPKKQEYVECKDCPHDKTCEAWMT